MITDEIDNLIRDKKYQEAEKLLIESIEEMELKAVKTGQGVAPWFYDKLSGIYKKTKQNEKEIKTLQRFLHQIKARGSMPKRIYGKYVVLMKPTDENKLQQDIYSEYTSTIEKSKLKTVKKKCNSCGKIGIYPIPQIEISLPPELSNILDDMENNYVAAFGTCCPFCCESMVIKP